MILSIHQPSYFPWLGLIHKINQSDIYLLMDEVQLNKKTYQNKNIFLDLKGNVQTLTIPVSKKGMQFGQIKDYKIVDNHWQKKHLKYLIFNYDKSPYFEEVIKKIDYIFSNEYTYLIDVLLDSIRAILELLQVETRIFRMSELNYNRSLKGKDLVLELLSVMKPDLYISGRGAADFITPEDYLNSGFMMEYQNFNHPEYSQINTDSFVEGMSSLDMLFNCGIEESTQIIKNI